MSQRFPALRPDQWGPEEYDTFGVLLGIPGEQVPRAGSGERYDPLNFPVIGMLAHHPPLASAFLAFNNFQLFRGTLPDRLRELAILRVAQVRRSPFEYGEHVRIALAAGITPEEVEAAARGNDGFGGSDLLVLRATDELLAEHRLADTWDELVEDLGEHPAMEVLFVVGTYSMLATAFETWGLPAADDAAPLPPPA